MTTITNFAPSVTAPFQFAATLDGQQYNVIVTWNLFRGPNNATGGFYVNVYDLSGTLVVARALTGSAVGLTLQSLSWSGGKVTATTDQPHGYKVGRTLTMTVSGAAPDAYNGLFDILITGPSTFTYALSADPGAASAFGAVSYDISMTSGYFDSTLVFRTANQQFEISP